jgi:dihydroxyacetone kinase-like predicted kinase
MAHPEPTTDDLRYEVMFFLEAPDDAVSGFKEAWAAIGDSIVVVGGDGLWNCHIHTNDIGAAMEAGIDVGRPRQIRVTDLADQIEEEHCRRQGGEGDGDAKPHTATAVVAVGSGDGITGIFRSLGVHAMVTGGQSMNPSTAELLEAIEATRAAEVVLLPNNRNVVPVAERAVDADSNAKAMAEASEGVRWGEVTWAVRDATTPAGSVKEGEHLALLGHEIVAVAPDAGEAACALLVRLIGPDDELVTVLEGEAATPEATERITSWLAQHRPDAEVEVHRGDQPLAAYLFSVE